MHKSYEIECYSPSIDMDAAAERLLVVFKRNLVYLKTKLGECIMNDLVKPWRIRQDDFGLNNDWCLYHFPMVTRVTQK